MRIEVKRRPSFVMRAALPVVGMAAVATLGCGSAQARPLTAEDLAQLSRIAAPVVSGDGRWIVWTQRETDLAANRGRFDLWRMDLSGKTRTPTKLAAMFEVDSVSSATTRSSKSGNCSATFHEAKWPVGASGYGASGLAA